MSTEPQQRTRIVSTDLDLKTTDPLSYLEDRISAILRGKPVRDLGEAIGAVRQQIEQFTRDRDALFVAHAHEMVRADIAEGNGDYAE